MPADTSKPAGVRRASRKVLDDEDIDLKRLRGEISCAECRRLKLRCDKKVPCGSCVRRGCQSVCPSGTLMAGQGTRFILADTERLHKKISDMSDRIRQLEDALAITFSSISGERHPLLQDEYLKVKFGSESLKTEEPAQIDNNLEAAETIEALGTLTLDDHGDVKYFGRSAGSETILMAEDSDSEDEVEAVIPDGAEKLANLFPFSLSAKVDHLALELLESFLPPHQRAWELCQTYFDHGSYFFRPLCRDDMFDQVLATIYTTAHSRNSGTVLSVTSYDSPHTLATLFFVLALGALLDLQLPAYNKDSEFYYNLGRAALSQRSIFESPQVDTVQAVGLMATYHTLGGKKYSRDSAWCLMALAGKLAQSIGLHRDSAKWNLEASIVQRRRVLFWEIFSADVSHSLALGRPPAVSLAYVDCEFPNDEEATVDAGGNLQQGFWRLKHTFAKTIFMVVAETTLSAKPTTYAAVLELDRKVRQLEFTSTFLPYAKPEEHDFFSPSLSIPMLYLHRSFFSQAMLDFPANPLRSPYAPSFLTAYRCSTVIIRATAHQFERCADLMMRIWFLLYHTFSAAMIVGSVVTRSPNSSMAPNALVELGVALSLFQRTAQHSHRARVALNILTKLQEKAIRVYAQFRSGNMPVLSRPSETEEGEDQLAIFGGRTRLLPGRRHKSSQSMSDQYSPQLRSSSSPSSSGTSVPSSPEDVQPSLLEYFTVPGYPTSTVQGFPFRMEASDISLDTLSSAVNVPGPSTTFASSSSTHTNTPPLVPAPNWNSPHQTDASPFAWFEQPIPINDLSPDVRSPVAGNTKPRSMPASGQAPVQNLQFLAGQPEMAANRDILGLGLSGLSPTSGSDEQWLNFIRECGIFDTNFP